MNVHQHLKSCCFDRHWCIFVKIRKLNKPYCLFLVLFQFSLVYICSSFMVVAPHLNHLPCHTASFRHSLVSFLSFQTSVHCPFWCVAGSWVGIESVLYIGGESWSSGLHLWCGHGQTGSHDAKTQTDWWPHGPHKTFHTSGKSNVLYFRLGM